MITHIPVLLNEVIEMLSPKNGGLYFDGTFGGGGYSSMILNAANCNLIACDRDEHVKNIADEFSQKYGSRFRFFHQKFSEIKSIMDENYHNQKLDGLVLDLGLSNFQITDASRGFSFKSCGPLDMSMGLCDGNAFDAIHNCSEKQLADIIYKYGEEHFSRRIAKNIKTELKSIKTTEDLANIVRKSVRASGKIDPATKTFQALRIFVNNELGELEKILNDAIELMNSGGKIIVVSFHSLEDRIVKIFFKNLASQNKCKLITKKPIIASKKEVFANPKSRSAKLRGIFML